MRVVVLFDVDNTLLDNDRVTADLRRYLEGELGPERTARYFALFEELRRDLGYADYLGALQRYRAEHPRDPHALAISQYLVDYPFANRLYPGSLDAIDHAATVGLTAILSDGDAVFQPRKVHRSGLFEAVGRNLMIYVHKEHELDDVERRYPADHYVLVDDKIRILTAVKAAWGERVTTVFPRQGHYAHAADVPTYPEPDVTLDRIGSLVGVPAERLLAARPTRSDDVLRAFCDAHNLALRSGDFGHAATWLGEQAQIEVPLRSAPLDATALAANVEGRRIVRLGPKP
jgi:FMN phosphatase YigB (HAD superfamily)